MGFRKAFQAGTAPGGPEVDDNQLSFELRQAEWRLRIIEDMPVLNVRNQVAYGRWMARCGLAIKLLPGNAANENQKLAEESHNVRFWVNWPARAD